MNVDLAYASELSNPRRAVALRKAIGAHAVNVGLARLRERIS
jgi:hypothetical protein